MGGINFAGISSFLNLYNPLLKISIAVDLSGTEECPPAFCAVKIKVTYPFSPTPIEAIGFFTSFISSVDISPPSSTTISNLLFFDLKYLTTAVAPFPLDSSSAPKHNRMVCFG